MAKHDRILRRFPWILSTEATTLTRQVCAALAAPLEEADSLLFEIQRAHRIRVAEASVDILRLAASLNLEARHFADLLERHPGEPAALLDAMRRRVARVAALHLDGLGTPWAVVEAAAIMLDAEIVRLPETDRPLRTIDRDGYSHVADLSRQLDQPRPAGRIYLHENPLRRRSVAAADRRHLDVWFVSSQNVEPAPATITIEGLGDRTVLPTVFCPTTGESLQFHGLVPPGARLTIGAGDGARLDGRPIDDWITADVGARADYASWNAGSIVVERFGDPASPFDGDLTRLVSVPYRRVRPAPAVPPGSTEWRVTVAEGVWNRSTMDFAVFAFPKEPPGHCDEGPGFDGAVFDYEPSVRVAMSWSERIPCAFKLLIPGALPVETAGAAAPATPMAEPPPLEWRSTDLSPVAAFVDRCKPAGVRAYLDVAREEWILGAGVLQAAGAAAPTAPPEHTVLRVEGSDLFIPIDPSAPTPSP